MNPWRQWSLVVLVGVAVVWSDRLGLTAQEQTPQARISGAWELDASASSRLWSDPGPGSEQDKGRKGSSGDANAIIPPSLKAAINLMDNLAEVPRQMALTAKPDAITLIDDHGALQRFTANNQPERISVGSTRASVRTRWVESRLMQDVTADNIDLSRTFDPSPDGKLLTVTLTVRRQPDPKVAERMGDQPATRRYVYKRQ